MSHEKRAGIHQDCRRGFQPAAGSFNSGQQSPAERAAAGPQPRPGKHYFLCAGNHGTCYQNIAYTCQKNVDNSLHFTIRMLLHRIIQPMLKHSLCSSIFFQGTLCSLCYQVTCLGYLKCTTPRYLQASAGTWSFSPEPTTATSL